MTKMKTMGTDARLPAQLKPTTSVIITPRVRRIPATSFVATIRLTTTQQGRTVTMGIQSAMTGAPAPAKLKQGMNAPT